MEFQIDFNKTGYYNDEFLIEKLGAFKVPTNSNKYPPFEVLHIEVRDFEHLEEILSIVDKEFGGFSDALISFDPPSIFLEIEDKLLIKTK